MIIQWLNMYLAIGFRHISIDYNIIKLTIVTVHRHSVSSPMETNFRRVGFAMKLDFRLLI